jgi:hypothetical protein
MAMLHVHDNVHIGSKAELPISDGSKTADNHVGYL